MRFRVLFAFVMIFLFTSCGQISNSSHTLSFSLASFTENYVDVSIHVDENSDEAYSLATTFTPPKGYHLYSKDIPLEGVKGLGRPTLLEFTGNDQIKILGKLTESVEAVKPDFEPRELLVYPSGTVTLSLPIELPHGIDWFDGTVKVTYMACSATECKSPVMGKTISVRIPGTGTFK